MLAQSKCPRLRVLRVFSPFAGLVPHAPRDSVWTRTVDQKVVTIRKQVIVNASGHFPGEDVLAMISLS